MSSHSVLRSVIQPKQPPQASPSSAPDVPDSVEPAPVAHRSPSMEGHLALLVENTPVALAMFDEEMRYIVANRVWVEEFGLQHVQPLAGRCQYDIFPGLHPGWRQVYDRALQGHVVRSEHDAISGQDGKPIIYRWEVRPWRRGDASVGGLMVICEKFSSDMTPVSGLGDAAEARPDAAEKKDPFFQCSWPLVLVDHNGVVQRANAAATELTLAWGVREGESWFWDAFGTGGDTVALRDDTLASITRLLQQPALQHDRLVLRGGLDSSEDSELPASWMLSRSTDADGRDVFVAMALPDVPAAGEPGAPAAAVPPPAAQPAAPVVALLNELQEKLNRTRQELGVLREAEVAFTRREARQRAVLDSLACGLLVLDERGMPIYNNEHIARLLGRGVQRGESVEQWLMHACPGDEHQQNVSRIWVEDIWSRQLTRILSLATADGLLKELEFRPVPLTGGGLLISIHDVTDQCRVEDLLRSTEAKFRTAVHENPAAILIADATGSIFDVNPVAEQLLGRAKTEIRRLASDQWLAPESAAARKDAIGVMAAEKRRSFALDVQVRRPDDSLIDARLVLASVTDGEGRMHCVVHFLQRAAMKEAAEILPPRAPAAADAAAAGVASVTPEAVAPPAPHTVVRWLLQTDPGGRIATWSADAQELFGYEAAEAAGRWLHTLFRPSDPSGFYAEVQDKVTRPEEAVDWSWFAKDGVRGAGRFFVKPASADAGGAVDLFEEHRASPPPGGVPFGAPSPEDHVRTHIVKPSQLWPVADLDREKLLLSETHHRIKNHLQIISSMLNLQINTLSDQAARSALRSSQNRVRSIAALHQHLYQLALGDGPSFVEFASGLAQRLRECYEVPDLQVVLHLDIDDGRLQQEWMMPLALILNETLSNAFEHAFPNGRSGSATVRLALNDGIGEFEVRDDGVGLPDGFDPAIAPGLGLKILGVFAEQMRGELRLTGEPGKGTRFNLRFPMAHLDN